MHAIAEMRSSADAPSRDVAAGRARVAAESLRKSFLDVCAELRGARARIAELKRAAQSMAHGGATARRLRTAQSELAIARTHRERMRKEMLAAEMAQQTLLGQARAPRAAARCSALLLNSEPLPA